MEIKASISIFSDEKLGDFLKETNSSEQDIIEFVEQELKDLFSEKYIENFKINFIKIIDEVNKVPSKNSSRKKKKRK